MSYKKELKDLGDEFQVWIDYTDGTQEELSKTFSLDEVDDFLDDLGKEKPFLLRLEDNIRMVLPSAVAYISIFEA